MAAELVMEVDSAGVETGLARMVLRNQGWHGLAHVQDPISLTDCHRILGTNEPVRLEPLQYADGSVSRFSRGVRWKNGNKDLELAVVGHETGILQNRDFINCAQPWLDQNIGLIEGAGLLSGGATIFLQNRAAEFAEATIRTLPGDIPDTVTPYVAFANGHGGMGMLGGWTDVRVVCNNTLSAAMRAFKADTSKKKTHRAKDAMGAGEATCLLKMNEVHAFMIKIRKDWLAKVEGYKFLETVPVKGGSKSLYEYSLLTSGKDKNLASAADFDPSKKDMDLVRLFSEGQGNLATSWWDVFNAKTAQICHGRFNEMEGDRPGDAKARRFEDLLLGTRATELSKAYSVALEMAKLQN